jgi:hypothetical protein
MRFMTYAAPMRAVGSAKANDPPAPVWPNADSFGKKATSVVTRQFV